MSKELPAINIRTIAIAKLLPAGYNPRSITTEALAGLKSSIARFGLVQPIVWNERTGNVVGGHQRLKVLAAEGLKKTEVVVVDLSESEEKALNLALNNPGIQGQFTSAVKEILAGLKTDLPDLITELRLDVLDIDFPDAVVPEFREYDESCEEEVELATCPKCGHEFAL